ncbi:MAG: hypothetical protein A2498_14730 [Lentisphaerae bacterium RIFOXYC12_FULL_60_16]|nr:MAG: hypothetical protein A2498_14730 [Lentisphaerae bacterium RIFOXYC12_FULL_60_16]
MVLGPCFAKASQGRHLALPGEKQIGDSSGSAKRRIGERQTEFIMATDVVIFYAPMCGLCHKAMDYFKERGITYEAVEVRWKGEDWEDTPNARRMKALCGDVDFVPQILIRGRHIPGWRNLEPMIESGELEQWLKD